MLPSRGFFKKNDCPFFEKGLCVRPHCHFRHRKKVVSENSSSLDSQDLLLSKNLVNSINNESLEISTSSTASVNDTEHSNNGAEVKENETSHDSLFAKLVNQSNQYEKISRHIPCAYTPTPQIRGVQPKNRAINLKNNVNNSASLEVLAKTQSAYNGYKSVTKTESENKFQPNKTQESNSLNLGSDQNKTFSVNSYDSTFVSKQSECKIPFFDSSLSDALCYEPQSSTTSTGNNLDKNKIDGSLSSYVPSKVTSSESKYVPNSSDLLLSCNYVPSKEKPKQTQYVPEPTGSINDQVTYKPSDKTSGETQYQPEGTPSLASYVPTEKSSTKTSSVSWMESDVKNELTKIDFISSEIEMMKELLKDEVNKNEMKGDDSTSKTELLENKTKHEKPPKEKHKSSKSHHSTSHKSESSSHSHSSSSKSKHSSSRSSSQSSRHHSSGSSKHHHSSKSSKSSDRHKSSSESHKKSARSSSHEKSKHHSGHKSDRHKSKEKSSRGRDAEDKIKKRRLDSEEPQLVSSDDDAVDGFESDLADDGTEGENEGKKRKGVWEEGDRQFKLMKKTEEELFEDFEEDPDTVEKQCLEIFNSYSPASGGNICKKTIEVGTAVAGEYENAGPAKKRTAHSAAITSDHSVLRDKTAKKSNRIKSAQEVMLERYKTVEKAKESQAPPAAPQPSPILGLTRPSVKIAAVSNIQQMLQAKKAIQEKINQGIKVNERTTIAQTVTHGGSRVAHTPNANKEMAEKPTVSGGSKQVPRIKRQIYLDKLLLETNQIYPTKGESAEEAVRLEEEIFRANSGSSSAYHAAFISMLLKTRRRVAAVKGETSKSSVPRPKMSHYEVLSGGKRNFSVIKTKRVDIGMLSDRHIYEELLRCKLTPEELKENSFPLESDRPGYATCALNFELKYNDKYLYIKKMTGNRRYCIRCSKQYEVDPTTLRQYKEGPETCSYHPGKKKSGGRNSDRIYNCCNSSSTEGCATHVRHVTDCNDYENLPNCVKTLSKEDEDNPGVYALDCEMVYTRLGYELARVTVVNLKKEVVYDTLVKPKYPIECYNTYYSGIEEKMMEGVQTTLKDVQAVLLSMFSDKTILIGHSLDSDLRALHLIHDTVVDTAVVYKNEKYHPYKYSLKDLCAKKISKIIQDNVNGHDSAEDAIAALEIMLNHVKEEVGKYDSLESYESDRKG